MKKTLYTISVEETDKILIKELKKTGINISHICRIALRDAHKKYVQANENL